MKIEENSALKIIYIEVLKDIFEDIKNCKVEFFELKKLLVYFY